MPDANDSVRSLFSPCDAICLSIQLRAAFGNSTRQENVIFAAINEAAFTTQ